MNTLSARLTLALTLCGCGVLPAQTSRAAVDRSIRLTPAAPSSDRRAVIVAPGYGLHDYNIFYIDTREFRAGGVLDIDIQIAPNSATDASFDLFSGDMPPASFAHPGNATLRGLHDIRRGSSTRLEYRFAAGEVFAFGAEGNWNGQKGATGLIEFRATVQGAEVPAPLAGSDVRMLRLAPSTSSVERTAIITGPGNGQHDYNVFYIDTRAFPQGGTLDIDIQIAADSAVDGSFDLFPGNMSPASLAHPGHATLAGRYDVRKGSSTRLEYRFPAGEVFTFGVEGN